MMIFVNAFRERYEMKRVTVLLLGLLLAVPAAIAQDLRFRADGTFKIAQITDVHYNGSAASKAALNVLDSVLTCEKPDLIVLDGDIIWGTPAKKNLLAVLNRIAKYRIPFVYEFGNHDFEQGLSNRELYDLARGVECNICPYLQGQRELDYVLRIKGHQSGEDAAVLYCFDSHAYPKGFPQDKSRGTYAWLTFEQVDWYRQQSRAVKESNGGKTLPALAFFHIALPEYRQAATDENATLIGTRREPACSPEFNSGMFTAMMECGDVMGTFVGHDHDNDYAVMWHNILLAYGRYSGGNTVYNHLKPGARIIVLEEGKRRFSTYIREWDGRKCDESVYPDSYVMDDWTRRPLQQY